MRWALILILLFSWSAGGPSYAYDASGLAMRDKDTPIYYPVRYLEKTDIRIDGTADEPGWGKCVVIRPLHATWENDKGDNTSFRACFSRDYFYFSFKVEDTTPVVAKYTDENSVAAGDRVELFFSADANMHDYYCMEISPEARVLDYQASYYRIFDSDWNMPGADIRSQRHENGYSIEGRLPLRFFKRLARSASIKGRSIRAGIFRADKKGGGTDTGFTWFTWKTPQVDTPDFHIPSALGVFQFGEDQ
ncbi:carbohydrate-binding family 9-like protein [Compostibacter hankyongensis]|uniref:Carbohydrate-binding domain-containing protein n=1 Tax=Compostibacter hankyongensis TaxID=1007089 RepID=A0ABP8FRP9_9BACT